MHFASDHLKTKHLRCKKCVRRELVRFTYPLVFLLPTCWWKWRVWKPCLGPTHINKYSIMCWDVLPPDEEFSFLLIFHKYSQILANIRSCAEMFSHQTKSLAWCCFFRELSYKLQTPSVWSNNENFLNRSRTFLVVLFLLFDSSSPQQTLTRCWRNVLFFPQTYFRFLIF